MGEPNSAIPDPGRKETGVTFSRSGKEDGVAGPQIWHLLKFTFKPVRLVSDCRAARALSNWILVPIRAPSSKYQEHHGTVEETRVAVGWRAQAKRRGPNGSPCWTPDWDLMMRDWQNRLEWVPYMEDTQGTVLGHVEIAE